MPTIINCTKCKTTVDMSTNFTILFADWSFTPKHDPGQLVGQFRPDLRLVLEKSIICNLWNVSLLSQKESNNKEHLIYHIFLLISNLNALLKYKNSTTQRYKNGKVERLEGGLRNWKTLDARVDLCCCFTVKEFSGIVLICFPWTMSV